MGNQEPDPPGSGQDQGWYAWVSRAEFALLNVILVASLGLVLVQVVSRSVFGHPLSWTDESSRIALVWLTFVGAGYLMGQGKHLSVSSFASLFPTRVRMVIEIVSNIIVAASCISVLIAGIGFVGIVGESVSTALSISMAWFYGAALFGTAMVTVHCVVNSIRAINRGAPIYPDISDEAADQHLDHPSGRTDERSAMPDNTSTEGRS